MNEKVIVGKNLLDVIARCIVFYKNNSHIILRNAFFDKGVYKVIIDYDNYFVKESGNIVEDHIMVKELVDNILDNNIDCRDNDMLLLFNVWSKQGIDFNIKPESMNILFNSESVTRCRRKIQNNEGRYLPTSYEVAKKRRINQELMRKFYGKC